MPKPVYIICAESLSQDRTTNLVSLSSIVERVQQTELKRRGSKKGGGSPIMTSHSSHTMHVVAVWMRESQDDGKEFESQFAILVPPHNKEVLVTNSQPFKFSGESNPLQRFILTISGFPIAKKSGILWVESRVRKKGNKRWVCQRYPIIVDVSKKSALKKPKK